jgi:cytochrome P450
MNAVPTTDLAERDYFTDHSILLDPYAFFDAIRAKGPVYRQSLRDVVFVTGFKECVDVLNNSQDYSSSISLPGAGAALPFKPQGHDISEQLEKHRKEIAGSDLLVTYDGARHVAVRSLLTRLFVPSRLKANEAFMDAYADELVKESVAKGYCDLVNDIATPYVTLVIADLLGVPDDDRMKFREFLDGGPPAGNLDTVDTKPHNNEVLEKMGQYFYRYVTDRRQNPREDILSELANAKYPDGTTADVMEVVRAAVFLFAAGQDTSAKLLGNSLRFICESPALQNDLRANPSKIGGFMEEVLRMEGSSKITSRLAIRDTHIGDQDVPAGSRVLIALAAANRDPQRWEELNTMHIDRARNRDHVAFGRGAHTCIGSPLARAEVRVMLEKLLAHTSEIRLSVKHHGEAGKRNLAYEASFIIRGLEQLHLDLSPRA